jgi:RHS repeat-associated protein
MDSPTPSYWQGAGVPNVDYRHAPGSWTPLRDYVWLDGKPLAQLEYPGPQAFALHVDHLGLPRAMTSSTGATIWSATTRPYGDLLESSSTGVVTNLRLPGQYDERLLSSIGIQGPYYNWSRWYLPMAGRYLELDPIAQGGGFNTGDRPDWFTYVEGNPIRWSDPTGQVAIAIPVIVGAAADAAAAAAAALAVCTATKTCPWSPSRDRTKCEPPPPRPPKYVCTAKCQANGGPGGAYYVFGKSTENCGMATLEAKLSTPPGQYPRHCSCNDTEGFRGVGHQCEAHRR